MPASKTFSRPHASTCKCITCQRARDRKAKAELESAGTGRTPVEETKAPLNVDMPILVEKHYTTRQRVIQWMEYRQTEPGLTTAQIAKKMGITPMTLYGYVCKARREGWLEMDDPTSRIDFEIIPKVLDNLNHFLDAKDKTVTIETAKGTIFKAYQDAKGISDAPQTVLALKIETVGVDAPKVITGHVVGKPRELTE